MRIKPWMEVQYQSERTKKEELQQYFKYDWYKCKSLKKARRLYRQEHRGRWRNLRRERKLLNELYMHYLPGSRAESCGLGNFWMGGVVVVLGKRTGRLLDIYVKDTNGKRGCALLGGGGCVNHIWYEPIYHETETEVSAWDGKEHPKLIGTKYITEFGEKIVLHKNEVKNG